MPKQESPSDVQCGRCYRYFSRDKVKPHDVFKWVCEMCDHAEKQGEKL